MTDGDPQPPVEVDPEAEVEVEPLDAGDDDGIPADLIELHEVLAWQEATS